jgi:hypothetical protein
MAQQAPPAPFQQEKAVARQFVEAYYRAFDTNRAGVAGFFRDASTVSFEGSTVQGAQGFLAKLQQMGLPPQCAHRIVTLDAQPSQAGGGAILVFVTGELLGQQFAEVFQLVPEAQASFYVHNNVFRVGATNGFNVPAAAVDVAKPFIEYYFRTYDTQRTSLAALYRQQSVFSFEDDVRQGPAAIMEKIAAMPRVAHDAASITCDVQQVNGNALLLVFLTGRLSIDEAHPLNFSETFLLVQEGQSYFVGNDIFRLKYG